MTTRLFSLRADSLTTRVEFPARELPSPRDPEVQGRLSQLVHNKMRELSFPARARLQESVDEDGDLSIVCYHDTHHFGLIVGPRFLLATKRRVAPESDDAKTFAELVKRVFAGVAEMIKRAPAVANYEHSISWELTAEAGGDQGGNKRLLAALCDLKLKFPSGRSGRLLRGDIEMGFILDDPLPGEDRNYWLNLEAPYNKVDRDLDLSLRIQAAPEHRELRPQGDAEMPPEQSWREACDLRTALDLVDRHLCKWVEGAAVSAEVSLKVRDS